MVSFECDYIAGAHPEIIKRLTETNMESLPGYGMDHYTESAKDKIRKACACPEAQVELLVGGTQTNAVVIDAFLRSYQGVIAAGTGHISVHEAGAIEASGHKVLTIPGHLGKLDVDEVRQYAEDFYQDPNHEHMVMPGMVYISHPTEYGTLYNLEELKKLREVCDCYHMALYVDGARLAYALACPDNEITLPELAALCDAFYIGGTKCGALFGEAVVIPDPDRISGFFTIIKQHGALFAKGRLLGLQFDTLFTDGLYERIGVPAILAAQKIREALLKKGYRLCFESPTNQIFVTLNPEKAKALSEKVEMGFWENLPDGRVVMRLATSWATSDGDVDALIGIL